MPCWYFIEEDLDNTPSAKAGVSYGTEGRYRREGAKLIVDAGTALGLRYDVCATGVVFFHRFYMFNSFTDFHRYVTGTCCLFLAAKMDESSLNCDTIIKTVQTLLTETQFRVFGNNAKQEILITEKIVLESLKFDLVVEHPYTHLLKFIKLFKGEQDIIEQLLKMSWTFVNDSLCTTLCIQWEPDLIAVSLLYLSCRLLKFNVTDWIDKPAGYTGKWYQFFLRDVTLDIIEDVCRQVLDLYAGRTTQHADRYRQKRRRRSKSSSASVSPRRDQYHRHRSRESPAVERQHSVSQKRQTRSRSRSSSRPRTRYFSPIKIHHQTPSDRIPTPPPRSPAAAVANERLLSREAFEALQRLMRRDSGLPADIRRSPSPLHMPLPMPGPYAPYPHHLPPYPLSLPPSVGPIAHAPGPYPMSLPGERLPMAPNVVMMPHGPQPIYGPPPGGSALILPPHGYGVLGPAGHMLPLPAHVIGPDAHHAAGSAPAGSSMYIPGGGGQLVVQPRFDRPS